MKTWERPTENQMKLSRSIVENALNHSCINTVKSKIQILTSRLAYFIMNNCNSENTVFENIVSEMFWHAQMENYNANQFERFKNSIENSIKNIKK